MPPKHQPKPRDTHFLCFPLVTDTSIPQLARSLAYFRETTTIRRPTKSRGDNREESTPESHVDPRLDAFEDSNEVQEADTPESSMSEHPPKDPLRVVHPKAHRPPGTFHLTLGVMNLSDPERMKQALNLLQKIDYLQILRDVEKREKPGSPIDHSADIAQQPEPSSNSNSVDTITTTAQETIRSLVQSVSPPPLKSRNDQSQQTPPQISITLKGMGAFTAPRNARVLYAPPSDPSNRLYAFADAIRQIFKDAEFITETRPLVLHATVANTTYVTSNQRRGGRGGRRFQRPLTIDAREVVKSFNGVLDGVDESSQAELFVWAEDIVIDRVRICKMGATPADDEVLGLEYRPVGEKMIFPP